MGQNIHHQTSNLTALYKGLYNKELKNMGEHEYIKPTRTGFTPLVVLFVAKLLYNYLRPSVCPSVRPSDLGGNVIFSAPN